MDEEAKKPTGRELTPKQQVVDTLKGATNVMVTIARDPSIDQLAACIGLTLMLNKLGKHATAVFSGAIPSIVDFLEPENTLEPNTDSLRDFIISLDKSKADKLRYKVEDDVVRIYITPYRTSISDADLDFTQGDFNVDAVVALGIYSKDQLDGAIMEHGQILHDATVIDLSCGGQKAEMGAINWHEETASSLSEMLVSISEAFQSGILDEQMATAFLTGIVAETERFSNERTTPKVMTISAQLMAAGANQQLIATQLAISNEPMMPAEPSELPPAPEQLQSTPGELEISHAEPTPEPELDASQIEQGSGEDGLSFSVRDEPELASESEEDHSTVDPNKAAELLGASGEDVTNLDEGVTQEEEDALASQIEIDEHGKMTDLEAEAEEKAYEHKQKVIQPLNTPPPVQKTDLSTVNLDEVPAPSPVTPAAAEDTSLGLPVEPQVVAPPMDPQSQQFLDPAAAALEAAAPAEQIPNPAAQQPAMDDVGEKTLQDLEVAVNSPHISALPPAEQQAMREAGYVPTPPSSLPQFPLPDQPSPEQPQEPGQPTPPAVPPPLPFAPQPDAGTNELNLPPPQ